LPDVTPRGSRRLEISLPSGSGGSDITTFLDKLRLRPGVVQATIFGQAIHALVDETRSNAELGLEGLEVRPTEPSLEDVFVAMSRAQQNGA
jgi:ribosome-dependent ATPase